MTNVNVGRVALKVLITSQPINAQIARVALKVYSPIARIYMQPIGADIGFGQGYRHWRARTVPYTALNRNQNK